MKKYNCLALLFFIPLFSIGQNPTLSLQEAIQIALQNNYNVVIAKNEVEIGKINNSWANADALPTVSASSNKSLASNNLIQDLSNGTNIKRNNASSNNINAGLAVNWQFYDGMKMFATKKRLEELEKIGQINFSRMMNSTTYEVMQLYYYIIQQQQILAATKESISLFEERLKIAEFRFNNGSSAKTDFLQAQVDLNEQKANLKAIEATIEISKTNLNTVLARDASTSFSVEDTFNLSKPIDFTALQTKLDKQNFDIQLAKSNLVVLMQNKKEINSQRLPSANLFGNYNFNRTKNAAGFTLLNQTYGPVGGIGLTIPIYSGGKIKRQLQAADIQIKNQDIAVKQTTQLIQNALSNAYINYKNGIELAKLQESNLIIVKENNFINLERFKKLSITSVELRQGQLNYTDAQTRLINAKYQSKMAEAEMLLLVGEITN